MSIIYKINNLSYQRDNEFSLHINELVIQENTISALLGANGSGKTTLLNLLAKNLITDNGQIEFKNQNFNSIKSINEAGIAYVHQSSYLLRGTVEKNLTMGLRLKGMSETERNQKLEQYIDILNLRSLLERPSSEISGGEAQRVAIGRMLVMDMQVLILDEPFTYLDEKSCSELEDLFVRLVKEKQCTIIFSTHDKHRAAAMCDQMIKLDKGTLLQSSEENILHGIVDEKLHCFKSGDMAIYIPHGIKEGKRIVIDARQIILSRQLLDSSMQNSLPAKILNIESNNDEVKVILDIGNQLQAIITPEALHAMNLKENEDVYASFKSSAVMVY